MNDLLPSITELIVSSPRVTGQLFLDGALVLDSEAQAVVEDEVSDFDKEFGISLETNEYGCVRLEAVEQHIAELLASDDQIENKVGAEASQFYGFMVPGYEYNDFQRDQISKNSETLFAMSIVDHGIVTLPFQRFNERFMNQTTGETKDDRPTSAELRGDRLGNNRWVRNPDYNAGIVPNTLAVRLGNFSNPDDPAWADEFGSQVGQVMVDKINKALDNAVRGVGDPYGPDGVAGAGRGGHVHHPRQKTHSHDG